MKMGHRSKESAPTLWYNENRKTFFMTTQEYTRTMNLLSLRVKLPLFFVRSILALSIVLMSVVLSAEEGRLVEMRESKYNNIYVYQSGDIMSMTFGHNRRIYVESVYNTKNQLDLPVSYTRYMTAGLAYGRELSSLLEIGLGAGRASWYVHKHLPRLHVTSAEIDPDVVLLAKKYFGIREEPNFTIVTQDGRVYLARNKMKYDIIFIDAYRGPFVPFHLLTREFYLLVKSRLNAGGVVVQNIEPSTMLYDAAIATVKSVFPTLETYQAEGNVVLVAYDGPAYPSDRLMKNARALQRQYKFYYDLPTMIRERKILSETPAMKPLTDDFAPVEYMKAVERHNRKMK